MTRLRGLVGVCLFVLFVAAVGTPAHATIGTCDTAGPIEVEGSILGTTPTGYATLGAAFTAINAGTHTGVVTVEVCADSAEGTATATLNASGAGAASYTALSIKPVGGVARTISGATTAGASLIRLDGADNVTIDGVNTGGDSLTIANTTAAPTSLTATITFINGATNNVVTNASIQGSFSGSATTNGGNVYFATDATTTNGNDNNTISNCDIGPAGANLPTKAIYGNGTATSAAIANSGIVINNNNIFDYFGAAVTSAGVFVGSGNHTWSITNNRFYQTATRTWTTGATHRAIDVSNSAATTSGGAQAFTITGNTIGFASSAGTGTYTLAAASTGSKFMGIQFNGPTGSAASTISSNTIAGVSLTGATSSGTSTSSPFTGILVTNGNAATNSNTIGSATVAGSLTYSTGSTSTSDVYGIYNFSVDNASFVGNNIGGISAANTSTGADVVIGLRNNTGSGVTATYTNNNVGGTAANSILNLSTATGSQTVGILNNLALCNATGNTVRNLTGSGGTGTTTAASVIGIANTGTVAGNTVSQNTIRNLSNTAATGATSILGIQYTGATTGTNVIARNFIHTLSAPSVTAVLTGISVTGGNSTYQNNMIALGNGVTTSAQVNGVIETGGANNFYHNSVYIGGTGVASGTVNTFGLNSSVTTSTRNYRDNVLQNSRSNASGTGAHFAIQVGGTTPNPTGLTTNNNVLYVNGTGGAVGRFNALSQATLANWQSATGQDAQSFSSDPIFLDPTGSVAVDLHINPAVTTVVEGNGAAIGSVTDDFDGDVRASFTPTDIGADAGNFIGLDLTGPVITYTAFANTTSTTNRTLSVSVTDLSGVPTAGAGLPVIYFRKGAVAYSSTPCSFVSGSNYSCVIDYSLVTGGSVTAGDTIQYYVAAQDNAGNVSVNPSAGASGPTANPPAVSTPPTTPSSYLISTAYSGSYTVGTGGTYTSLTNAGGAFAAINAGVLSGDVTLDLVGDSTAETGANALNQWAEEGVGNWTLTIRPQGGATRTVSGTSSTALIKLNGADRVTIDGLNTGGNNLFITNTNTSTGTAVIWLASLGTGLGATNDTIRNCTITAGSNTVTSYGVFVGGTSVGTTGADDDNVTITGNTFLKAANGVVAGGTASVSTGGHDGLVITGNTFGPASSGANNLGLNGVFVTNVVAPNISQNTIRNVASTTSSVSGIALNGGAVNATVSQNSISAITTSPSSVSAFGIFVGTGSTGATISRNTITNITETSTGGYPARGIYVNTGATGSAVSIVNNAISDIVSYSDPSPAFSFQPVGIMIDGTTGGVSIYHNSVNLFGTHPGLTSATLQACLFVASTATSLDVRNNVFVNSYENSSSTTEKSYAVYSAAAASAFTSINNNDYFVSGAAGVLGFLGADQTTLAAWKTATGQDAVSLNGDPLFNSSTNLAPQTGSPLLGAGAPLGVTIDLTGASRSGTTPTIGAYENATDIAGPAISYTTLGNTTSVLDRTLTITATDPSGVPTSGTGRPALYFRKGTSGPYTLSTCTFVSGSTYDCSTTYGSVGGVTGGDTIQYWVAAQDNAGNVSSNPSGGVTPGTNPPGYATPPTPNSYLISAAFTGPYTVGSGGLYASLTNAGGAFEAINAGVLTGNVTLEIVGDSTAETGLNALNPWAEEGAGNWTLTMRPSGGARLIAGSNAGALIRLNGADRVTIEGSTAGATATAVGGNAAIRELTIQNTNTGTSATVISVGSGTNGAQNNVIRNVNVLGQDPTTTLLGISLGGTTPGTVGTDNDNNVVENCSVKRSIFGIYSAGASTANPNVGTVITMNETSAATADRIRRVGVLLFNENGVQVTKNSINGVSTTESADGVGIAVGVQAIDATTTTTGGITNALVARNKVNGVASLSTTGFSAVGIAIAGSTGGANTIVNNMVTGVTAPATSPDIVAGIYVVGATGSATRLYNNSVAMTGDRGAVASQMPSFGIAVTGTDPTVESKNNIFYTTQIASGGGANAKSYAIGMVTTTFVNLDANNNDYWSNGANDGGFRSGSLGAAAGTDYATIALWRTAISDDAASLEVDPSFVAAVSDLHLDTLSPSPVENQGVSIGAVTDDFDGFARGANPEIGADEVDACATATCSTIGCSVNSCDPAGLSGNCSISTPATVDTLCRASAGDCDVAETCDGTSTTCPADAFIGSSFECRPSAGDCDVAETCTGSSATCPADSYASSSVVCRGSAGDCDVAETCTGSGAECPADVVHISGFECRAAAGDCDVAETCDGVGTDCPTDSVQPSTHECRASAGTCDVAESCTGSSAACPADQFEPSTTTCRGAAGTCDVAEACTGSSAACPADAIQPSGFECRGPAGTCDVAETCDGSTTACPADAFEPATTECRGSAGICDLAESCTGSSAACPTDVFQPDTYECRASTAACDPAETCTGTGASCPADSVNASTPVGNTVAVSQFGVISTISWTESEPGPFNVYRGARVANHTWMYNQGCFTEGLSGSSITDTQTPLSGQQYFYLITRKTTTCNESGFGLDSAGNPRPTSAYCPNPGPDTDNDGVLDAADNCPLVANPSQADADNDLVGDACDNCPVAANTDQWDRDGDNIGDVCDPTP